MSNQVFSKQLEAIDQIIKKVSSLPKNIGNIGKTTQKALQPMNKFNRAMTLASKASDALRKNLAKVYSIAKMITFAGMGLLATAGARGIQAQKQTAEAKTLGVTNQQREALEYAGKQTGRGEGYFKDILSSIRNAMYDEESYDAFGALGLDPMKLRKLPALEVLQKVLEAGKNSKIGFEPLQKAMGELTGMNIADLQALDLNKFKSFLNEGLSIYDNSANKISKIGEGLTRLTANLGSFMDKVLAKLSPAITALFNGFSRGLSKLMKNKSFNAMLNRLGSAMEKLGKNIDRAMIDFFNSLPKMFKNIQLWIYGLMETYKSWTTLTTDKQGMKDLKELRTKMAKLNAELSFDAKNENSFYQQQAEVARLLGVKAGSEQYFNKIKEWGLFDDFEKKMTQFEKMKEKQKNNGGLASANININLNQNSDGKWTATASTDNNNFFNSLAISGKNSGLA